MAHRRTSKRQDCQLRTVAKCRWKRRSNGELSNFLAQRHDGFIWTLSLSRDRLLQPQRQDIISLTLPLLTLCFQNPKVSNRQYENQRYAPELIPLSQALSLLSSFCLLVFQVASIYISCLSHSRALVNLS